MLRFHSSGSDFDQNYYEYELPMTVTPWYTGDDNTHEANNFDISLRDLQDLKVERGTGSTQIEYSKMVDNARISVKGNPNISSVISLLIGVQIQIAIKRFISKAELMMEEVNARSFG